MTKPLPPGWKRATVGEVFEIIGGSTPRTDNPDYWDGDIPWLTPDDLSRYKGVFISKGRRSITVPGFKSTSTQMLPENSVIFSSRAPIGYVAIAANPLCTNQGFKSLIVPIGVLSEYVYWYLQHATPAIQEMGSGTTFKEISKKRMAVVPFLLPPTNEQKRIVDVIEEHFSRIDAVESAAQTAFAKLDTLRRTVLTAAFSGHLVEPFNPRRTPDGLPEDWQLSTIGEVTEILDSKRIPLNREERAKRPGNVPYYGATGQVGWIDEPIFNERLVLLGEDGAPFLDPLKDKAYIIDGPSWVNNHAHVLKADSDHISNELLKHQLNCCPYNDYVTGTTRLKLTQRAMRSIPLKLPPLPEQERIVDAIEEHFSRIDTAKVSLERCLQRCGVLRRAILSAAFSGRLVKQDPNDEPASVLLERIAAEQPKRRTRRKSA